MRVSFGAGGGIHLRVRLVNSGRSPDPTIYTNNRLLDESTAFIVGLKSITLMAYTCHRPRLSL